MFICDHAHENTSIYSCVRNLCINLGGQHNMYLFIYIIYIKQGYQIDFVDESVSGEALYGAGFFFFVFYSHKRKLIYTHTHTHTHTHTNARARTRMTFSSTEKKNNVQETLKLSHKVSNSAHSRFHSHELCHMYVTYEEIGRD